MPNRISGVPETDTAQPPQAPQPQPLADGNATPVQDAVAQQEQAGADHDDKNPVDAPAPEQEHEPVDLTEAGKYAAYELTSMNWTSADAYENLLRYAFPHAPQNAQLTGGKELNTAQATELLVGLVKRENKGTGKSLNSLRYRRARQMTIRALFRLLDSRKVTIPADAELSRKRYFEINDPLFIFPEESKEGPYYGQLKFTPRAAQPEVKEQPAAQEPEVPAQAQAPDNDRELIQRLGRLSPHPQRGSVKRLSSEAKVGIGELSDRRAVEQAIREHDESDRRNFLDAHEFGRSTRYYLQAQGRLYDAKAIAGVAYGYQFPEHGPLAHGRFNGGEAGANVALRSLGYTIVDARPNTIDGERAWRLAVGEHFGAVYGGEPIDPRTLRDFGVYGGAQGIWVASARTRSLDDRGITVGVLHTGLHYPDDLTEEGLLYHYPHTNRPAGRDQAEIAATKAAAEHRVPLFVINHHIRNAARRQVHLGWVEGWDDDSEMFLITFTEAAPTELLDADHSDEHEFRLTGNRSRRAARNVRVRPGQSRFKFRVFQRYGTRCPLSGVTVPEMLDAAHLVPDAQDGTDDPRNGLPLNAALHRAFDANLFTIDPDTLKVITKPDGPTLGDLGITTPNLERLPYKPHREALQWRYRAWREHQKPH